MGCRRRAPASALVRVVAGPEATLLVGRTLAGRGAWLCARSPDCLRLADRRNAFTRALRAPVSSTAVAALEAQLPG